MIKETLKLVLFRNSKAAQFLAVDITEFMTPYDLECMGTYMVDAVMQGFRKDKDWSLFKRLVRDLWRFHYCRSPKNADKLAGTLVWYIQPSQLTFVGRCYLALAQLEADK
jgi:hypothetical protein